MLLGRYRQTMPGSPSGENLLCGAGSEVTGSSQFQDSPRELSKRTPTISPQHGPTLTASTPSRTPRCLALAFTAVSLLCPVLLPRPVLQKCWSLIHFLQSSSVSASASCKPSREWSKKAGREMGLGAGCLLAWLPLETPWVMVSRSRSPPWHEGHR